MTSSGTRFLWFTARPAWQRIALGLVALLLMLLLLLAIMPWGLVAARLATPLGTAIGRPVRVGGAERVDTVSFVPTVALRDVEIGQPHGFGTTPLARIRRVELRFPVLPLLVGRFRPRAIVLDGADVLLLRTAEGRANWNGDTKAGGGDGPALESLTVRDSRLRLIDRKRQVTLAGTLAADAAAGIAIDATGTHRGTPLTLRLRIAGTRAAPAAPLRMVELAARSPLATLSGRALLAAPLDTGRFSATLRASGTDLRYLDDFIEAGLFPTRPFTLAADVRHVDHGWEIPRIAGEIGRTALTARLAVARNDGRTRLTGRVDAARLDFDDFSSAKDRAEGAAMRRRLGPRVIPATRIRLDKLGTLDGSIDLDVRQLLGGPDPTFRSLKTRITLDRRRLVARPLVAGLRSGTIAGGAVIDHRGRTPALSLDMRLRGARIERLLLPGDAVEGPMTARIRLRGTGSTMREAMARADGRIGLAMRSGSVRRDYAIFAGGDVMKTIGTLIGGEKGARTPIRCLIADLPVHDGVATARRLALDTPITRADGSGRILLADERIDLSLAGRARDAGPLLSTAPVRVTGTLSDPTLDIRPPRAEKKGRTGVFDRIGFLIKGLKTRREAQPAGGPAPLDCGRGVADAIG